jgi:hypothetical protein
VSHVWRLCCLPLALIAAYTPSAAQGVPTTTEARIIGLADIDVPLPPDFITLRAANGQILNPSIGEDGELIVSGLRRKLTLEFAVKGLKQRSIDLMLEHAPVVYITLCVDPATGHVKFLTQKADYPGMNPSKAKKLGSGTLPVGGPGDACATPFPVGDGPTPFDTMGFSTDGPANCLGTINNDIWYDYTASGTGLTTFSTCGSLGDTKLAVYTGLACPPGAPAGPDGCSDDDCGLQTTVTVATTAGSHYLVRLGTFSAAGTASGTLTITPPAPPVGGANLCEEAPDVTCNSTTTFDNTTFNTSGSDPAFSCRIPAAGTGFGTAWFKFLAPGSSAVIDTEGSVAPADDTLLAIYDGTCGALVEIGCDDDSGTGLLSLININTLTPGNVYYIQVASWSAADQGTINLNLTCDPDVAQGDTCEDPFEVTCDSSTTWDNSSFGDEVTDPAFSCYTGGPANGVGSTWLTFVATDTSAFLNTNASTGSTDTLIAVYEGTCGAFTEIACSEDEGVGFLSEVCVSGLTVGNTYYVQVASFDNFSLGEITLEIDCPCPAPPDNDNCEDATLIAVPSSTFFDNTTATDDILVPCELFSGPFKNVWFQVAGTGTTITATTCNAGTEVDDTKISVFCADCLTLVCVAGNDDDCPGGGFVFASTVNWCSQLGADYLITVGNFSSGTTSGVIQLDVFENGVPCVAEVSCLPQGACCLDTGVCVVLTSDACAAAGGDYQGDGTDCDSNAVADGGFENGPFGGVWTEFSTNFGTPVCDTGLCGFGGGTGPFSGTYWTWFGGAIGVYEEGSMTQSVTIPVTATTLDFQLEVPVSSGNGTDYMEVTIDGTQVFLVNESDGTGPGYFLVQVPLGAFADGGVHTLEFHSEQFDSGAVSNFFVDDVAINSVSIVCPLPTGACCLSDGSCVEVTADECAAAGGTFNGEGTLCVDANCIDCFDLDFETDDSGAGMVHGTKVDTEFDGGANFPVTITGSANASGDNTAAILNSTTGPASSDPDLLVGSGNILILQTDTNQTECPPASGVYCTHNDDEDGGTLSFAFNGPTSPDSIDLVDIDATDPAGSVVLTDVSGNTRTYTVPANWTGDLVTDATSGMGTLDLTTLAPQPGFGSIVTAAEDAGFDPDAVVQIDVNLGGSGGVDNLSWCE